MKIGILLPLLLGAAELLGEIAGAKILVISFMTSKSHYLTYGRLLEELVERGHELTIVNALDTPLDKHPRVRRIKTFDSDSLLQGVSSTAYKKAESRSSWSQYFSCPYNAYFPVFYKACAESYKMKEVQALRNEKFDLIFFPPLWNDCVYGLVHELKAPVVLYNQMAIMPWVTSNLGNPSLPSIVPMVYYNFPEEMNFGQRVMNLVGLVYFNLVRDYYFEPKMEELYRSVLGQHVPSVNEIERNASIALVNSNINFVPPRPLTPDVIEVGGLYLQDPKPLQKDLKDFCDGAKDGVILISFGSILKISVMPPKRLQIFFNVFAKLKQRVIMKWEDEDIKPQGLPSNVKLVKWIPQADVLGHKNTQLFITHGGHGSTSESLYAGVPMVGIPMFGEQEWNIEQTVLKGYAVSLVFNEISEQNLMGAIQKVLQEPKYRKNAQFASQLYRDQTTTPLSRAVFWIEYVIRYQGAPHMSSVGRHLSFVQYYSLDVLSFLAALVLLVLLALYLVIKTLLKLAFGSGSKKPTSKSSSSTSGKKKKQ